VTWTRLAPTSHRRSHEAERFSTRVQSRVLQSSRMATLETFANTHPGRDYTITHTCPEFTALCPKTGQPDFATIRITYVPDKLCVELKSLKLYLFAYRDRGIFYEHVTNVILDDLVGAVRPRSMTVEGEFNVRGGIGSVVRATYEKAGRRRAGKR
jgi:7-cyano-7-deazaguanine reductase